MLILANGITTIMGLGFGINGTQPLFAAYMFSKYLPNNVLDDSNDFKKNT